MNPKRRIIPVFIPHYGCRHACVFCNQHRITGAVNTESVLEGGGLSAIVSGMVSAMESVSCDVPIEIAFYGGSFTAIPISRQRELLEATQPFLALNPLRSIRLSTRPDCIDEDILRMLKSYGVQTIELGAQSMCDDVLRLSKRGHTADDVKNAATMIKAAGFSLILQMMTGLPGDTREKSLLTARRLAGMAPDGVRIYPTVVIKGTSLFDMWQAGEYHAPTVGEAVELCALLCPIFFDAGIPVIRLGLNPTDELSAGDAVAGAYHPAFGELVYSKMYYDKAVAALRALESVTDVLIVAPFGHVSWVAGYRRQNIHALKRQFNLNSIRIVEKITGLKQGEIIIEIGPL